MTKPARDANQRWPGFLLAAIFAALVMFLGAGTASAATATAAQTRVGAHTPAAQVAVGLGVGIGAGQRLGNDPPAYDFVLATGVAAKTEGGLLRNLVRGERGSIGLPGRGTTEAGNRGALNSGKWYDSKDAARRAAERYAAKHPNSCTFRGLCGAGDHYHVDKELNGYLVHTRHYYFPR